MDVYSTNCPKCKILVKKLTNRGKEFNLIEDNGKVMAASEKYDIPNSSPAISAMAAITAIIPPIVN